ncbi:hypothetical protein RJ639_041135 [Escallonia herrerae]|uniref:Kinesin-like protein n=1 Tax=Escallonia herrerae TaxID=1293975 RepID=A0AA88WLI2_9ASTE|nr:hypothetical protein RJ639_041135 [Escallonia herrerae]
MEDHARRARPDLNLASRKAEEAALRRFQATQWLESLVGPLGITDRPSEREFIACLRNGLILCNAINKIKPGSVPKVVEIHSTSQLVLWDSQPLPAYQFFENVRNFLVAVVELKLQVFEASVLEGDNMEEGSSTKIVDCILELKSYHEWKQMNGFYKPQRSPLVLHSTGRSQLRGAVASSLEPRRKLDMSTHHGKQPVAENETQVLEDSVVQALAECMAETKENIDHGLLTSLSNGSQDPVKLFSRILSTCLEEQLQSKLLQFQSISKEHSREGSSSPDHSRSMSPLNSAIAETRELSFGTEHRFHTKTTFHTKFSLLQCCSACLRKGYCNHWKLLQTQENELTNIKDLLFRTKKEFRDLQSQLQSDLKQLGSQVQELSTAALGYHKVVKENMYLYNMVQDLKGNIRVYCRVRPATSPEAQNAIDFIGEDGSVVVQDPFKPQNDGRRVFRFDRVFGPSATQEEVFKDTQPLIRSVMDGYNVCIFAYGQTGSGKTHTMSGPSSGATKELGINYLALNDLFQLSNKREDLIKYEIHVQMVEIYNEQVRDLLAEDTSTTKYPFSSATLKLEIRSCTNDNGLTLPDARMHYVKCPADVLKLMKLGEVNRAVSSTAINNRSSRSHSILTIHVQGKDVSGSVLRSSLHLVDLAGSERVDKTEVTGDALKEAQYINKSLSCLGDVVAALAQKNSYIPYQNSKLTLLLQNSLGGHAKTLMFAHVSPEGDSFGETVTTLKFAQRVSTVELGAARSNKESTEVIELKEQARRLRLIENLKKELANREVQTEQIKKPREARSPKGMTEQTPPRSRRLSIENGSNVKVKAINVEEKKGSKTPSVQARSRRLSLEGPRYTNKDHLQAKIPEALCIEKGSSVKLEKAINIEEKKGSKTPSVQSRLRRLSLEGPRYTNKDLLQAKVPEALHLEKSSRLQVDETATKPSVLINSGVSIDIRQRTVPRSPTSSACQSDVVKTPSRSKILPLQLPTTPDPHRLAKTELACPSEYSNSSVMSSTTGKASHIRKSLRTIGKLINGSDKRNQPKSIDTQSPLHVSSSVIDGKSPLPPSSRALRRQSLTGIQADRSRRSSLGGADSCENETRNARTPPPVHRSAKMMKRWM